jgi:hypothetical protein
VSRTRYTDRPMASRRARREQALESPLWDVWLVTAMLSAVLLTVGGWLEARLLGAVVGALVGVSVGAVIVWHNATARMLVWGAVHGVLARHRRHTHED